MHLSAEKNSMFISLLKILCVPSLTLTSGDIGFAIAGISVASLWTTQDVRPERDERWLNAVLLNM